MCELLFFIASSFRKTHRPHDVSGQLLIDDAHFATMIQGQMTNDDNPIMHHENFVK